MGTENGRNGGHMESLWWERGQPQRGVGRRSVYLRLSGWEAAMERPERQVGHISPHGPHWCNRCYGSIWAGELHGPNVPFQMLILAAVWRDILSELREQMRRAGGNYWNHLKWNLVITWTEGREWNGTKKADMGSCWRSDGLGSGLGLRGEWKEVSRMTEVSGL